MKMQIYINQIAYIYLFLITEDRWFKSELHSFEIKYFPN